MSHIAVPYPRWKQNAKFWKHINYFPAVEEHKKLLLETEGGGSGFWPKTDPDPEKRLKKDEIKFLNLVAFQAYVWYGYLRIQIWIKFRIRIGIRIRNTEPKKELM